MTDENKTKSEKKTLTKEQKRKNIIFNIVIIAAVIVLVIALVNIFVIKKEDFENIDSYNELRQYSVAPAEGAQTGGNIERTIDFEALQKINPDIVGWIIVPGTDIDYPITVGRDNEYYLTHGANLGENRAGAIFLDKDNASDFSGQNTLIHGHRMNDGSMFGQLPNFKNKQFFDENRVIVIFTPDGNKQVYEIFSAAVIPEDSFLYQISFSSDESYEDYLEKAQSASDFETGAELSADDKIITLSTCVYGQETNRYILQAALKEG